MRNNVNSFAENVNKLLKQTNIALESLVKLNESTTTENDTVTLEAMGSDPITGDPSLFTYSIPSYNYTLSELSRIKNSIDAFMSGQGTVLLDDGTFREVKVTPVAKVPKSIENVSSPTKFNWRTNWFFEDFLFPQLYVQFDLKDKIDDRSNRIRVRRIIFDNFNDVETQWFKDTFIDETYSYYEVITILNQNDKRYWIDEENQDLPLRTNKHRGKFKIINKETIEGKEWFYLNTLNYSLVTDQPAVNDLELKEGNKLRYENSTYKITSINSSEKRVTLTSLVGISSPTINSFFYVYTPPFEEKIARIPIGYNECNIVFIKGVNENYNILADEWGNSISFYTNDLTLTNSTKLLRNFYHKHVVDFGKKMEGEAKEKFIPAFFGVKPDAPEINADQLKVNQINTQLNAALDTEDIKNTQTQIESTKTIINSLKTTIAQQKAELVELTEPEKRADIQAKIDNNINQLSKKTIEYQSLVRSLATVAYESEAVNASPKYRVRGFFDIPKGKKKFGDEEEREQQIIQFEVAYRYLRLDNTGNPLNTYSYEDPSTGQTVTGTFTDWVIQESPIKQRKFNKEEEVYEWIDEDIGDGESLNINQIDIPLTKGEKVQIRLRSISEAGWPLNPQKSDWSESVIIDFPQNLEGSDQVVNILEDAQAEETSIKLNETLEAAGVNTHLQDGVPNPQAADGTYFKHQSRFIAFDWQKKTETGEVEEIKSMDLQSALTNISEKAFVKMKKPTGADAGEPEYKTVTIEEILQRLIDENPGAYDNLTNHF